MIRFISSFLLINYSSSFKYLSHARDSLVLRVHSDRFFKRCRAIFVSNIDLNKYLLNANIIQQFILIIKLKKSDLSNAYIELQKLQSVNLQNLKIYIIALLSFVKSVMQLFLVFNNIC